jgi:predicted HicB family RNase H-like nuclease
MVNINVEVPDELHKQVKLAAIKTDKTVKEYVIGTLDEGLRRRGR